MFTICPGLLIMVYASFHLFLSFATVTSFLFKIKKKTVQHICDDMSDLVYRACSTSQQNSDASQAAPRRMCGINGNMKKGFHGNDIQIIAA